jgi:predicted RNase H-like nuclease (RuvC/YqgF family)
LDEAKAAAEKEITGLRDTLRESERSHLETTREVSDLKRQIKSLESELQNRAALFEELEAKLKREEERGDETRRESFALRQKVTCRVCCSIIGLLILRCPSIYCKYFEPRLFFSV